MSISEPLTDEGIASLRHYFKAPRGEWNAFDALACLASLIPRFPQLLDEIGRARALLKRIEWGGPRGDDECPECGSFRIPVHNHGCALAALIGK